MKARNCTDCRRRIHEEEKENFLRAEYSMMRDMGKSFAVYAISAVLMTMIRRGRTKKYIQQMYDDMVFIFDTPSIMGEEVTTTTVMKTLEDEYGIDWSRVKVNLESEKEFVKETKNSDKGKVKRKGCDVMAYSGETDSGGTLTLIAIAVGSVLFWKRFNIPDIIYHRERSAIIRMDELRKDYDEIEDLETLTKMVESNPDVEVYMYCKYSHLAGGEEREVRIPIKPNSRLIKMLCQEEKNRLRTDMGRTKKIFNLPFHR